MKRALIKSGWLVTLAPGIGDFKGGELLLNGDRIEAVGRNLDAAADEVIDASEKIVMPGLVNAHMHTWETALRGIGAEWMTADYLRHMHLLSRIRATASKPITDRCTSARRRPSRARSPRR